MQTGFSGDFANDGDTIWPTSPPSLLISLLLLFKQPVSALVPIARPQWLCTCCGAHMLILRQRIALLASNGGAAAPPDAAREGHTNGADNTDHHSPPTCPRGMVPVLGPETANCIALPCNEGEGGNNEPPASGNKRLIALLRLLVFKPCGKAPAKTAQTTQTERPRLLCRCCGAVMAVMRRRILPLNAPPVQCNREDIAAA